jgi:target of rapamycin complex subunit LST8
MVTSSEDGTVKIWDVRTGTIQRNYNHGSPVNDVVIHPNQGELISCDRAGTVRVWDLGENKCSHQLIPEDDVSVASVTVASDGSMLCAGNNAVRRDPQPGLYKYIYFADQICFPRAVSSFGV